MPVQKGAEVAPAKGKLGVLLVGLGAVSISPVRATVAGPGQGEARYRVLSVVVHDRIRRRPHTAKRTTKRSAGRTTQTPSPSACQRYTYALAILLRQAVKHT